MRIVPTLLPERGNGFFMSLLGKWEENDVRNYREIAALDARSSVYKMNENVINNRLEREIGDTKCLLDSKRGLQT